MPGCRTSVRSTLLRAPQARISLSRYVRVKAVPPRAANDNRSLGPRFWPWALALGVAPSLALVVILSLAV